MCCCEVRLPNCFSFPLAYSCHQFCICRSLGPHVLVFGQIYEDTEDAGGNIEGQGKAGSLLGSLWHLGRWAWCSCSPEHPVMLWPEQWVQHTAAVQDVDSQHISFCVFIKFSKNRAASLALDSQRQQQSQAEARIHTYHGQHCLQGETKRKITSGSKLHNCDKGSKVH